MMVKLRVSGDINHPPAITIFIGGINHSQSWVVYDIVLPTLYIYSIQGLVNVHSFITAPIKTLDTISNIYLNDQKLQNWTFTKPCHLTGDGYQVKILYNCLVQRHTHGDSRPPKTYILLPNTIPIYIYMCVYYSITTHQ